MANICEYNVLVKGKKNGCYAFYGSMPVLDDIQILEEKGTDDNYEMRFNGDCKWSVDSYCTTRKENGPVSDLPEDYEEAYDYGQDRWGFTVQDRSEMYDVEVYCNSADVEDYDDEPYQIFEHYIKGEEQPDSDDEKAIPEWMIIRGVFEEE